MKRPAIKNVNDSPENQGLFWNVSFFGMGGGGGKCRFSPAYCACN